MGKTESTSQKGAKKGQSRGCWEKKKEDGGIDKGGTVWAAGSPYSHGNKASKKRSSKRTGMRRGKESRPKKKKKRGAVKLVLRRFNGKSVLKL